jgi:hypothetical protein
MTAIFGKSELGIEKIIGQKAIHSRGICMLYF